MALPTYVSAPRAFALQAALLLATLLAAVLMYADTVQSLFAIWNSSETFMHQYAILPITLWLIWQRRAQLAAMRPHPYWPALALLAGCGLGWLLAQLADVQVVRQYTFVLMLIMATVVMLGRQMSERIAFPLLFLLFAVPFGEVFIGPLIEFTANFTVAALRMSGIPVLREGNSFSIPSGQWSVVEACSGVRYLIASVTLGCLYAWLTYRSRLRQALFVLVSIVVPIVANGVRAYMIVMIGHLSGMELAVGVDHLIYGWLFFGLVMFLMFWIGSFWQEAAPDAPVAAPEPATSAAPAAPLQDPPAPRPASDRMFLRAAIAVLAVLALWPLAAQKVERAQANPHHADLSRLNTNWQDATPFTSWKPGYYPADTQLYRFFQPGAGDAQAVGLAIYYYRNQHPGSVLISSSNHILAEKDLGWNRLATQVRTETVQGRQLSVREEMLQSAAGPLLVWHWYVIDGHKVENDYVGKLVQAREKLLLRGDDGAAVFVFAPYADKPEQARQKLRSFLDANLQALDGALARNRAS